MAKMVKCKTCGQEIAASAKVCPHCGAKQKKFPLVPILVVVVLIVIFASVGGSGGDNTQSGNKQSAAASNETQYFRDGVLQTDSYRIEITDWRVIQPGEDGNAYGDHPIIAFWYNTTNLKEDDTIDPTTTWMFAMSAIQDNDPNTVNTLNVSALPDSTFLESQLSQIKPGGTLANAVGYELTDDFTPVTLKASLLGLVDLGEQTFSIAE